MDQSYTPGSTPSLSPHSTSSPKDVPHNPYQRLASRRAIACVTCAKAKTKCDKGLPHCSRCVAKGIKCEPRSTRRTSENGYRPSVRRTYASPKRYNSTSAISSLSRHNSPRIMPLARQRPMRAASYIDFQNAVKMDQQDSAPSGLSVLTPLPTYLPHNPNEGRTDDVMANDNLMDFKIASEANNFPVSGRLTPQTPEPILYHEPLNMNTLTESWIKNPSWSDDSIMSLGSSYDSDMTAFLPTDMWSTTHFMNLMPVHQMSWPQPQYSYSPQSMSSDMVPHARAVPPLSIGDYSVDNCNNSGTFQNGWSDCQIASDQSDLIGLVSCAPFDLNLSAFPSTSPIWEDVFVPAQPY